MMDRGPQGFVEGCSLERCAPSQAAGIAFGYHVLEAAASADRTRVPKRQVMTNGCDLPVPLGCLWENLRTEGFSWSISGETQQSFGTYCSCFRSTFNYLMSFKWLGRRNQWISGRQGVWFPLELLRTEFFFTMLLNRLWTAGILSVTTLLFAAFRLTAGQPCVEIVILLGRCRWWGCFLMISVVKATAAYRFWVQRSRQRGRRGTVEPRGFLYMSCWLGSFGYNSISFSSCSNPVPAHISNTIWS